MVVIDVTVDRRPEGVAVVRPVGRLDWHAAAALRQGLADLVAAGQTRLVVDLAGVAFLDSSGVGALLSAWKAARAAGGDLRLVAPPEQTRVVFRLAMLHQLLRAYPTEAQALDGL